MNTTTITASRIDNDSAARRFARAFLTELSKSLTFLGRAYGQGVPPF